MMCYHGVMDTVVPLPVAQTTYGYYEEIKYDYDLTTEYNLQHAISPEGKNHMRHFLAGIMNGQEVEKWISSFNK